MNSHQSKAIATVSSAAIFGVLIYVTKGESGAGWFLLSLLIIW